LYKLKFVNFKNKSFVNYVIVSFGAGVIINVFFDYNYNIIPATI
jgi:hypothetical protein